MLNLILVNVIQTLFDNAYQNCELLQKIDVSKTAKEVVGEEGYWMPQTVRRETVNYLYEEPKLSSRDLFTVKQSIQENISGCA